MYQICEPAGDMRNVALITMHMPSDETNMISSNQPNCPPVSYHRDFLYRPLTNSNGHSIYAVSFSMCSNHKKPKPGSDVRVDIFPDCQLGPFSIIHYTFRYDWTHTRTSVNISHSLPVVVQNCSQSLYRMHLKSSLRTRLEK